MTDIKTFTDENGTKESSSYRFLLVVDLGNSSVKAASCVVKSSEFNNIPPHDHWNKTLFSSIVSTAKSYEYAHIKINDVRYLVGEDATQEASVKYTGDTKEGKIQTSVPLIMEAISRTLPTGYLNVDLIFTSPTRQDYESYIKEKLNNTFSICSSSGELLNNSDCSFRHITFNSIHPQGEGLIAAYELKGLTNLGTLIDVGHRTIIVTRFHFTEKGEFKISKRAVFDNQGVESIVKHVVLKNSLTGQAKYPIMPTLKEAKDYLFDNPKQNKKGKRIAVQNALEHVSKHAVDYIKETQQGTIHLCGGGASLPGLEKYFNATTIENSRWANVNAICDSFNFLYTKEQERND